MGSLQHSLDLLKDTYNYNHWIYSLIRPHLGESILEIGSGTGNITQFLLSSRQVTCLEPEPEYTRRLKMLTDQHLNLKTIETTLEKLPEQDTLFNTVICLNVLEHIEDDFAAVRKMTDLVQPGGNVLLYVPACQWAFGAMDSAMGHYRRYSKRRLRQLAAESDAELRVCHAVNLIGLMGWFWAGRIQKETHINVRKAHVMDRMVPFISAMEKLLRPPAGQSLFAVIQKPGNGKS